MIKPLATLWSNIKENALFLVQYRRNKKRREQDLENLEIEMGIAQIELAFAMLAEQKVRRNK